jgi:hypothetical protein
MKVGYTEFSFGYAFTENLIRSSTTAPVGAPVFPNLVQEGQWGYDVRINIPAQPLFFQFKLPEIMRRSQASEIAKHKCSGLAIPFFRIGIMRRDISSQHALLIELEKSFPHCVYYVSPCLDSVAEFDLVYNAGKVHERSLYISPSTIGLLSDDKQHSVAYREKLSAAYFLSEPRAIEVRSFDGLSGDIRANLMEDRFGSAEIAARQLRRLVPTFASAPMRQAQSVIAERIRYRRPSRPDFPVRPEYEDVLTDILVAREIARVDMGLEVLLAQPVQIFV